MLQVTEACRCLKALRGTLEPLTPTKSNESCLEVLMARPSRSVLPDPPASCKPPELAWLPVRSTCPVPLLPAQDILMSA